MTYWHIDLYQRQDEQDWRWRVIHEATVSDTQSIEATGKEPTVTEALIAAEEARDKLMDMQSCEGQVENPKVCRCVFCGRDWDETSSWR